MNDPYIVHSTKGFVWLTNNEASGISLTDKSIFFDCDIILNDETFDEKGSPNGGDGVIYSWQPIKDARGLRIDGKNFGIYGLYINDDTQSYAGLFGEQSLIRDLRNLKVYNVFINAKNYVSLFNYVYCIENVHLISGVLSGQSQISGMTYCLYERMSNCSNHIKILAESRGAGLTNIASTKTSATPFVLIENSYNYGDIIGEESWASAGILMRPSGETVIENCVNYGDITAKSHTGGIVAIINVSVGYYLTINNCKNYGFVSTPGGIAGGIIGYVEGVSYIYNCENYGDVFANHMGQIMGTSQNVDMKGDTIICIKNCKGLSDKGGELIGTLNNKRYKHIVSVENCVVKTGVRNKNGLLARACHADVSFKNIHILAKNAPNALPLIRYLDKNDTTLHMKNIFVEDYIGYLITTGEFIGYYGVSREQVLEGIVVFSKTKNVYYGTDFSGYYIDWKTGKMGLKALSGKGFYQGGVTEDSLIEKGFAELIIK